MLRCWTVAISKDDLGIVQVGLYAEDDGGQLNFVDAEQFGPTDTTGELVTWLTRKLLPLGLTRLR